MKPVGNKKNLEWIDRLSYGGKLSHAYLFVGPKYNGKTIFARYLAQKLLCTESTKPCGECISCRLFEAGNHPDFLVNDTELAVGIDEIRELTRFLDMKPYQSQIKVALISHFEHLSVAAANSFLKTLEEPAKNTVLILTAENVKNLLPTVISRSQVIKFREVPEEEIVAFLVETYEVSKEESQKAVKLSGRRVGLAARLIQDKDKVTEIESLTTEFGKIVSSNNLVEKLGLAETLAKDKETLMEKLDFIEIYLERKLKEKPSLKISYILDKIAESRDYLYRNGNARLVLESLMLSGE